MKNLFFEIVILFFMLSTGFSQTRTDMFSEKPNFPAQKTFEKGKKQVEKGKYRAAEASFRDLLKEPGFEYKALGYLAIIKDLRGDTVGAVKLFQDSIVSFMEHKQHLIERKTDYLKTMELEYVTDRAYLNTRKAGYVNNGSGEIAYNSVFFPQGNPALIEMTIKNRKDRVEELKRNLEQDKKMEYPAFFFFKLGNFFMKTGDIPYAKIAYLNAISSDPDFRETYPNLAAIYFMQGDCVNAKRMVKRSEELQVDLNPKFRMEYNSNCG